MVRVKLVRKALELQRQYWWMSCNLHSPKGLLALLTFITQQRIVLREGYKGLKRALNNFKRFLVNFQKNIGQRKGRLATGASRCLSLAKNDKKGPQSTHKTN